MSNADSSLVLATLLVISSTVLVVVNWFLRPRAPRRRMDLTVPRVTRDNDPTPESDRGQHLLKDILTEREIEVARLVAKGRHNKEIATEMSIHPHTVESHIRSIYEKLGVHTRVDLARELRPGRSAAAIGRSIRLCRL